MKTSAVPGARAAAGIPIHQPLGRLRPQRPLEPHALDREEPARHDLGEAALPRGGANFEFPALSIMPKLTLGTSGDRFELEADDIADRVMRMPSTELEHSPPVATTAWPSIQRKCTECEEDGPILRRQAANANAAPTAAPSIVHEALASRGESLDAATRQFMEPRFGHDFSAVRVHTGDTAAASASAIDALAYTVGRDIVFGSGSYAPSTPQGRRLLAHELTHTIQQGGSPALNPGTASLRPSTRTVGEAVQRLGDLTKVPPAMTCPVAPTPIGSAGTSIQFGESSATLSTTDLATLSGVAAAWHSGGGAGVLRIDGFASTDGPDAMNWQLSCDRASAVARELEAPTDGSPGVPSANLQVFAQGETSEFATGLTPNRRAVITTSGGAPAPRPGCALTIAGPTDLDHYCAAYVPSDAAACGVFPAPSIALTAAGGVAGAPLRWSVIRGATKAAIVGPSVGASVAVQGTAASSAAARGDVTVQVTDGTCTATQLLTVHEPTTITDTQAPTTTPTLIQIIVSYTVRDQYGAAMGAGICVDETITRCATSIPGVTSNTGDAATNAAGQVQDSLSWAFPGGVPADLCFKVDQTLTAGGCGPLMHNTISFQPSGVTLSHGSSCAPGDPCP
jgi:outer membrane protein OmpA-like peptidoglycan-associated protein